MACLIWIEGFGQDYVDFLTARCTDGTPMERQALYSPEQGDITNASAIKLSVMTFCGTTMIYSNVNFIASCMLVLC